MISNAPHTLFVNDVEVGRAVGGWLTISPDGGRCYLAIILGSCDKWKLPAEWRRTHVAWLAGEPEVGTVFASEIARSLRLVPESDLTETLESRFVVPGRPADENGGKLYFGEREVPNGGKVLLVECTAYRTEDGMFRFFELSKSAVNA